MARKKLPARYRSGPALEEEPEHAVAAAAAVPVAAVPVPVPVAAVPIAVQIPPAPTPALREICAYQHCVGQLIPRAPFERLVRGLARQVQEERGVAEADMIEHFTPEAIVCLQEAAEDYLVSFFEDVNVFAVHAKRVTIMQRDVAPAQRLRRERS